MVTPEKKQREGLPLVTPEKEQRESLPLVTPEKEKKESLPLETLSLVTLMTTGRDYFGDIFLTSCYMYGKVKGYLHNTALKAKEKNTKVTV